MASVIRHFANADGDDDVTNRNQRIEWRWQKDLVAQEPEQVVGTLGPVLDRLLDRFVDAATVLDLYRARWHSKVQRDHDCIERNSDCDYRHASQRQVYEAKREHEDIRKHQQ